MRGLTEKQARMLAEIERACADGLPPTINDLSRVFRRRTQCIVDHIRALERKGRVVRDPGLSRAMRVTDPLTADERVRFGLAAPPKPKGVRMPPRVFIGAQRCVIHEITTVGVPCPYCAGLRRVG